MSINLDKFVERFLTGARNYHLGVRVQEQFLVKAQEVLKDSRLDDAMKGRLLDKLHEALPVLRQEGLTAFDEVMNLYTIGEKNGASASSLGIASS